jgi:methionyl-tRNA formyltransferase
MRVSIIGQAPFGESVLERLQEDGVEVVGVSAPEPAEGGRPDPLWAAAIDAGIPTEDTAGLKEDAGLARWNALDAELTVMAFVTEILPEDAFTKPEHGTIQYHPSLLPLHRGSSAIAWPIIYGRTETGITIFRPDEGIDTGPVILQETCEIGPDDTVTTLYFNKLYPMGVDATSKVVKMVEAGEVTFTDQDHAAATYEPPIVEHHARIRWHEPAEKLYRLIRGCNSQPGAWFTRKGEKLKIFDCKLSTDPVPGMPGRILSIDDEGFDVRLNGGVLRVSRVQAEGARKQNAGEWAAQVELKVGARFR